MYVLEMTPAACSNRFKPCKILGWNSCVPVATCCNKSVLVSDQALVHSNRTHLRSRNDIGTSNDERNQIRHEWERELSHSGKFIRLRDECRLNAVLQLMFLQSVSTSQDSLKLDGFNDRYFYLQSMNFSVTMARGIHEPIGKNVCCQRKWWRAPNTVYLDRIRPCL